jgi:DNA topoisomerase-1
LTLEKAEELLAQPSGDRELGTDPATGLAITARTGRYGPYVTEVLPEDSKEKPRTASLFKTMSLETVSLEDALKLLQLPRVVGVAPDGEEVVARNGRYGPYVQKEKESRSLESEEQLFTITLEDALALLSQPRQRRGQRTATKPLRELGTDPVGGNEIVLKEGRFGPYVTDGETNASLRKGDDPETVTLDRALELLTDRRAKGPAKRPARRRKAS